MAAGLAVSAAALALAQPPAAPPASPSSTPPASGTGAGGTSAKTTTATTETRANGGVVSTGNPARDNLARMQRKMTVEFKSQRLEDVIRFIREVTQAEIETNWIDEDTSAGLDKDKLITLTATSLPALDLLERVLTKAQDDAFNENGWQMTSTVAIEIGPKTVLNRDKRVVIYDINDLLMVIPRYTEAPTIDLGSVLNQGEGGGGQSPFEDDGDNGPAQVKPREERIRDLIDLITSTVEPTQWVDNGGEGATIRSYGSTLIVNGPDYVHRQLVGYSYWPSQTTRYVKGRRYVSLTPDTGISTVDEFVQTPVTGVVGGSSGGGGGSGGTPPPPSPGPR